MLDTDLCRALPNNLGTVLSIIQSFLGARSILGANSCQSTETYPKKGLDLNDIFSYLFLGPVFVF